jgi:DNA mismatch repair protein MutS
MGGKSTYLRQVALIAIMAHIGSFVPAKKANIALLDRIFTRLGASDNVSEGKSTFLVEMEETATICTQATEKSLVILDEVGRGTSTFDGLAIAQAVVEYIFTEVRARCLFATHYHELTHLRDMHPGIVAYYAASKKTDAGIVFLYTMVGGVADGSFGIEVAKLAHLPAEVIARSAVLVSAFNKEAVGVLPAVHAIDQGMYQENMSLKEENRRLRQEASRVKRIESLLQDVDFDTLSPKKAFDLLWEYRGN